MDMHPYAAFILLSEAFMKISRKIAVICAVTLILAMSSCISTREATTPATPVALAAPQIDPPALRVSVPLGEAYTSAFTADSTDVYVEFAVEAGSGYEIFVVDGYNNGANAGMRLDAPAKAVGYWICKSDAKTTYPESVYKETDSDSKGGYGFIGLTPDGAPGSVASIKAEGSVLFIHVQRYKSSYTGQFMVKVIRK